MENASSENMDLLIEYLENFSDWSYIKEEVDWCGQNSANCALHHIISDSVEVVALNKRSELMHQNTDRGDECSFHKVVCVLCRLALFINKSEFGIDLLVVIIPEFRKELIKDEDH